LGKEKLSNAEYNKIREEYYQKVAADPEFEKK